MTALAVSGNGERFEVDARTALGVHRQNPETAEIIDDVLGSVKDVPALDLLVSIAADVASTLRSRQRQALEILALRQRLAIYERSARRPRLPAHERVCWVWLSRLWTGWRCALVIVKPETVVVWHRFRTAQGDHDAMFSARCASTTCRRWYGGATSRAPALAVHRGKNVYVCVADSRMSSSERT